MALDPLWAPWAEKFPAKGRHSATMNSLAVRNGWLPFYPQIDKKNPLEVIKEARADGVGQSESAGSALVGEYVYVTRTGEKYHRKGCQHLRRGSLRMRLIDATRDHKACKHCRPP